MARKLRVQCPGAIYHVMNRGDHSETVFRDSHDPELFLATLSEACGKTGWQVHSFCLMSNHFHLVVETSRADLVAGMKWLLSTYTSRFNRKHKLFGHLFSGRYKALPVDGSTTGYLKSACDYVHLNPARARLIAPDQRLQNLSLEQLPALPQGTCSPSGLAADRPFAGRVGHTLDSPAGREQFSLALEARRQSEQAQSLEEL